MKSWSQMRINHGSLKMDDFVKSILVRGRDEIWYSKGTNEMMSYGKLFWKKNFQLKSKGIQLGGIATWRFFSFLMDSFAVHLYEDGNTLVAKKIFTNLWDRFICRKWQSFPSHMLFYNVILTLPLSKSGVYIPSPQICAFYNQKDQQDRCCVKHLRLGQKRQ